MTVGLPLMKSAHTPLAESVLLPLGLSAGMSAANAAIQKKKNHGSGTTALTISNEEISKDIMKVVKSLEESGLLVQGISKTKEQKSGLV